MFRDLLMLLGIVAAIAALSLAFLSQRYWFARGWRFAGRLQRSKWRTGMRAALLSVLVIVILIAFTDLLRNWRGTVSLSDPGGRRSSACGCQVRCFRIFSSS